MAEIYKPVVFCAICIAHHAWDCSQALEFAPTLMLSQERVRFTPSVTHTTLNIHIRTVLPAMLFVPEDMRAV